MSKNEANPCSLLAMALMAVACALEVYGLVAAAESGRSIAGSVAWLVFVVILFAWMAIVETGRWIVRLRSKR